MLAPRQSSSAAPFPAERHRSKGSHCYVELKEAILSGALPPGSPIDKLALGARLGASRFPVTTAVNRLAFEGLVVVAPQHGSFVARIAIGEVMECMMLRAAIESETAALAAARRPVGLVATLDRHLRYEAAAAGAQDATGFYALDIAFHEAILASLGLGQTAGLLNGLRARLERIRRILAAPPGRAQEAHADHLAVRDAVAAGDEAAARSAMRHHLEGTAALFRAFATANPSLFSDSAP